MVITYHPKTYFLFHSRDTSDHILQRIEIKHGPQVIETCIRIEELIVFLEQKWDKF